MSNYNKCKECKYLDTKTKCSIGYLCTHPEKEFRSNVAMWKPLSQKACKLFETKEPWWKEAFMRTFLGRNGGMS